MRCPTCCYAPVPVLRHELLQEIQLDGLRLSDSLHRPSSTIGRHAHRQAMICILVAGSFEESFPSHRTLSCEAPAVHVRPAGIVHGDRLGTAGAREVVIEVDDRRLESIRAHSQILDDVRELTSKPVLMVARKIQRELMIRDQASALALEGLTLELLGEAARTVRKRTADAPAWLRRVRELLNDRFRDPGLRLAELAEVAGVHPVYLARAFRSHYGASPGTYLRKLRIDWAALAIRSSERSLAAIAIDAGFADQSHLTRVFKAQIGWTPAAWRRLHRRDERRLTTAARRSAPTAPDAGRTRS